MKKLMIAAAIVCAAAFAQAATVNWATGDVKGSNGEYGCDNIYDSNWAYEVLVTFSGGDLEAPIASSVSGDGDRMSWGVSGVNLPSLGTEYMASIVITETDADGNVMTLSGSGAFVTNESASFETELNFLKGNGFKDGISPLAGATWQAVPEPTSGLLLLLGVAGLALRRRRA